MTGVPETHRPADLAMFHKNPRVGDTDTIAASLRANGQYKPLVVNRGTHTGRPMEVLAGNHTLKALRTLAEEYPSDDRWQQVECWVLDVDDDRAARIVAADNRTAQLGTFDTDTLVALLDDMPDLEGTGYSDDDLADLMAASSLSTDFLEGIIDGAEQEAADNAAAADDDDDDDDDDDEDDGPDLNVDGWLALTFSVTPDERQRIRTRLNEIKTALELDTQTEALVRAVEVFPLEEHK